MNQIKQEKAAYRANVVKLGHSIAIVIPSYVRKMYKIEAGDVVDIELKKVE